MYIKCYNYIDVITYFSKIKSTCARNPSGYGNKKHQVEHACSTLLAMASATGGWLFDRLHIIAHMRRIPKLVELFQHYFTKFSSSEKHLLNRSKITLSRWSKTK